MDWVLFLLAITATAAVLILVTFGNFSNALDYFESDKGRGVRNGILAFIGAGMLAVFVSLLIAPSRAEAARLDLEWFAFGEVYLGVEAPFTRGASPQCMDDGPDDKLTSNGGLRANIVQTPGSRFQLNAKYTHHSCAFNPDQNLYDAAGIEAVYRLW